MRTIRSVLATALVSAMVMALTAVPALAAEATAVILDPELYSGQTDSFTVRITNDEQEGGGLLGPEAGSNIDAFSFEIPSSMYTVSGVVFPDGFNGFYDDEVSMVFGFADEGTDGLAPSASLDVTVQGTAVRLATDRTRNVPVFVSDNGGITLTNAGVPTLTSRILEITDLTLIKPELAENQDPLQITERQDNLQLQVGVVNHASVARTIRVVVDKAAGTSGYGNVTTLEITNVPGGSVSTDFVSSFTAGSLGTLQLRANATAPDSAALEFVGDVIDTQQAFAATYVGDSLTPQTITSGRDYAFSLQLNKVGFQPSLSDATFTFTGFEAATSLSLGGGSEQITVTFPETTVTTGLNEDGTLGDGGLFDTQLTIVGLDANGATIDLVITPDQLLIDNVNPLIDMLVDVGQSEVEGVTPAAGSGRNLTVRGSVLRAEGGELCADCTIGPASISTFRTRSPGPSTTPAQTEEFGVSNAGGSYTATVSFDFGTDTSVIGGRGAISASKPNGLVASALSNTFDVDVEAPHMVLAEARRDSNGDFVLITMNEFIDATNTTAQDWFIDDAFVAAVTPLPTATRANQFRLDPQNDFGTDNPQLTASYSRFTLNGRPFDRVALEFGDQAIDVVDRISPALPVLDTVAGRPLQGGDTDADGNEVLKFFVNESTPTVTLSNLVANDVINLYWDRDDDGEIDVAERVFRGPATGESTTVTLTSELRAELTNEEHAFFAVIEDPTNNLSPIAEEILVTDIIAPQVVNFAWDVADPYTVTAIFNEPVPTGRNAAFDWTVYAEQSGEFGYRTVTSVADGASALSRTLTVSDASYDPNLGDVLGARFKYRGAPQDNHQDRAGNTLLNSAGGTAP